MLVADTHSLIWHLAESPQLGKKAAQAFEAADSGKETIIIPTIVLAEALSICEKKRSAITFDVFLQALRNSRNYVAYNLDMPVVSRLADVHIPELHDRVIVATAMITRSAVITRDKRIAASKDVQTVW